MTKFVKGDRVEDTESQPGFIMTVDEVFETGHVICIWPSGRRWVYEDRFLKPVEEEKGEDDE